MGRFLGRGGVGVLGSRGAVEPVDSGGGLRSSLHHRFERTVWRFSSSPTVILHLDKFSMIQMVLAWLQETVYGEISRRTHNI